MAGSSQSFRGGLSHPQPLCVCHQSWQRHMASFRPARRWRRLEAAQSRRRCRGLDRAGSGEAAGHAAGGYEEARGRPGVFRKCLDHILIFSFN